MGASRLGGLCGVALVFALSPPTLADVVADLFNTGVSADGTRLVSPGGADPHYQFVSGPQQPSTSPQAEVESITPPWIADGPNSMWVGVTNSGFSFAATGQFVFQTSFTLPANAVPSSAILSFRVAVDNDITDLALNGSSTGISYTGFAFSPTMTIDGTNGRFAKGTNTLTFTTVNEDHGGGPNAFGFRVDQIQGTFSSMLGDADDDGKVDFADLLILARHYGMKNATWADGDFNGDGTVGFDDLTILARNYGRSPTPGQLAALDPSFRADVEQAFADLPEPSGLAAALVAAAMVLSRRRLSESRADRR